jgi:hypothetical protein
MEWLKSMLHDTCAVTVRNVFEAHVWFIIKVLCVLISAVVFNHDPPGFVSYALQFSPVRRRDAVHVYILSFQK